MIRCLLVDDSRCFREAAAGVLTAEGVEVVGTACTGAEALALLAETQPRVVVLDVELGAEDGFEVAERIADAGVPCAVVLVSTRPETHYADRLTGSRAAGFLAKEDLSGDALRRLTGLT